jgi:hypothetical protein
MAAGEYDSAGENEEWEEWGPSINGYRFVGRKDCKKYYRQRHRFVTDTGCEGYDWSYMEIPDYKPRLDDTEETKESKSYIYDQYYKDWEKIKANGEKSIIYPLASATDMLILENVESFLRTSSDYERVLKIERIRWHPDKMLSVLGVKEDIESELLKAKVTNTFQIINSLYEETKK